MDYFYFVVNWIVVCECVVQVCGDVGCELFEVVILLVSKIFGVDVVCVVVVFGLYCFGENCVQEVCEKVLQFVDCVIEWVIIGLLQINKVKDVVCFVYEVQMLDWIELVEVLDYCLQIEGCVIDVLVQVKILLEESKYGIVLVELFVLLVDLCCFDMLCVCGLMIIVIYIDDIVEVCCCFCQLCELCDVMVVEGYVLLWLLMGMSGDFVLVIVEGVIEVCIGSVIFGVWQVSVN